MKTTSDDISKCTITLQDHINEISELQRIISDKKSIQDKISTQQDTMHLLLNKIRSNTTLVDKANHQIEVLTSDTDSIDIERTKLREFAARYVEINKEKKTLIESNQYQDFVASVLTDGGIKTKIIKQYIPTINKLINKYLTALDFFVSFHLDEDFNESIKSRHRDTFTYDNFSDGQKARIDLSLMFAWRDIAKMRNAVNTNILYLDEADAAVDADGASLLSDLLHTVEKSNVFIISHKGDLLRDKFERVITFDIENNFTVLSEI